LNVPHETGREVPDFTGGGISGLLGDNAAVHASALPAETLLAAAMRGQAAVWPAHADSAAARKMVERANFHGVDAYLHHQGIPASWPASIGKALRQEALRLTLWEGSHQRVLGEALDALHAAGAAPVIIKGTALAYCLYANDVRTRADTDLLVANEHKMQADQVLRQLGWQRSPGVSGDFVSYQAAYTYRAPDGMTHALDLHWKISNSEVLARLFNYDELMGGARSLPGLGAHAWAPSHIHCLLIACMHRATHRTNPYFVNGKADHSDERLIWLLDIHLLAQQMSPADWSACLALARDKGLCGCTREGLLLAQERLGTRLPEGVLENLATAPSREAASDYLTASKLEQQCLDLRALQGWRNRARLIREVLVPPAAYMQARYGGASWQLPWLYIRRAVLGATKRLSLSPKHARGRLQKFLALNHSHRRLLIQAAVLTPLFGLAVRAFGLARVQSYLESMPLGPIAIAKDEADRIARTVAMAARHTLVPATCLSRSLLLQWLLRRRGMPSELRIGGRMSKGAFDAHAWVEVAGAPVDDDAEVAARYLPFANAGR
jgi:hypothetical protein